MANDCTSLETLVKTPQLQALKTSDAERSKKSKPGQVWEHAKNEREQTMRVLDFMESPNAIRLVLWRNLLFADDPQAKQFWWRTRRARWRM